MTEDPYKILGVSPDATDEEIKRAYRRLAKQYHPDRNPGDAEAARKMQQINDAYERIKNPEKTAGPSGSGYGGSYGGYSGYGYGSDPFGGYRQSHRYSGSSYRQAAAQYIRFRRYREAVNTLENDTNRDAQWYYLSALANDGLGNRVTALEHIRRAVSMEPDNPEYLRTLEMLENDGTAYRRQAQTYQTYHMGRPSLASACMCILAQLFCCNGRCFYC